jgi:hypothetical protein
VARGRFPFHSPSFFFVFSLYTDSLFLLFCLHVWAHFARRAGFHRADLPFLGALEEGLAMYAISGGNIILFFFFLYCG